MCNAILYILYDDAFSPQKKKIEIEILIRLFFHDTFLRRFHSIQFHSRLAPLDESLPVADICSLGRVSVQSIRKARISPLSKSLGTPSRKRPAWITKSPRRGDSWTRTASTAFARKPAAITRISGLLIPDFSLYISLYPLIAQ